MQYFLQTPTPDLQNSIAFFTTLGYEIIQREDYTLAYDRQMTFMINTKQTARAGVSIIKKDWNEEIIKLREHTHVIEKEGGYYFADSSGCWFHLLTEEIEGILKTESSCILGNYAGLSLESMDIECSSNILKVLNFELTAGSVEQGWLTFTDAMMNTINIMAPFACPHIFLNPSVSFFNGAQNQKIIENIRALDISIMEEVTAFNKEGIVDNVILREPGGYGFFVFND